MSTVRPWDKKLLPKLKACSAVRYSIDAGRDPLTPLPGLCTAVTELFPSHTIPSQAVHGFSLGTCFWVHSHPDEETDAMFVAAARSQRTSPTAKPLRDKFD